MFANRVVLGTATVVLATGCSTTGTPEAGNQPTPQGDRVVVVAGNGRTGALRVGGSAVDTPLASPRAMAALPDGSLAVTHGNAPTALVRIDQAGRVGRIGGWAAFSLNSIAIRGNQAWFISGNGQEALRYLIGPPEKTRGTALFGAARPGRPPAVTVVDADDRPLPPKRQREHAVDFVSHEKVPAVGAVRGLVLLPTGRPIMVPPRGHLYQPLGSVPSTGPNEAAENKVRPYDPPGYDSALAAAGGDDFEARTAVPDPRGGFVVLGTTGMVRVPPRGHAVGSRFPEDAPPRTFSHWGATVLGNGDALIAAGGGLYRATWDGRLTRVPTAEPIGDRQCRPAALPAFEVPDPAELARLPDGTIVLSAERCNRVYAFRLPGS